MSRPTPSTYRARIVHSCTQCGICAQKCPVVPLTGLRNHTAQGIQKAVYRFLESGQQNEVAYTRAFSCMECYQCTAGVCPQGLNPLWINETIKSMYPDTPDSGASDSADPDRNDILARVQLSPEEYVRITTPVERVQADVLFFPGCNVYEQPEKILNALDLLEKLNVDYAFLPGLQNCCGERHLFAGDLSAGTQKMDWLLETFRRLQPRQILLWCPTCQCRLNMDRDLAGESWRVRSLAAYLLERLDELGCTPLEQQNVTLHEACKSSFTGLDMDAPREILKQIPGLNLIEMTHHGANTLCCGSGAESGFPDAFAAARDMRLAEAKETEAEAVVTVCHYCEHVFAPEEPACGMEILSYINLLADSVGIRREDRFMKYIRWGDMDRILADLVTPVSELPYDPTRVQSEIQRTFCSKERSD